MLSLQCSEHLQNDQTVVQGQQPVQLIVEGQQPVQCSNSPDQAVDQYAGEGGMFSTHVHIIMCNCGSGGKFWAT